MADGIGCIIGVPEGVRDGSPLDQFLAFCAIVGFFALSAGIVFTWYYRGVNELEEENAALRRKAGELRRDRDRLQREVEGLESQTTPALEVRVTYEERNGNREQAIGLRCGFLDHDAAALGPHCRAIANGICRWSRAIRRVSTGPPPSVRNAGRPPGARRPDGHGPPRRDQRPYGRCGAPHRRHRR
jgi:hypothetical protein